MTSYLVPLALLVLSAAIVLLFAMLGELASRIPDPAGPDEAWLEPLEDLEGVEIRTWPEASNAIGTPIHQLSAVVILTTVCTSCRNIATQLTRHSEWIDDSLVHMIVVAGSTEAAILDFAKDTGFSGFVADLESRWTQGEVGIDSAPSVLLIDRGSRVVSAASFNNMAALRTFVESPRQSDQSDRSESVLDSDSQGMSP